MQKKLLSLLLVSVCSIMYAEDSMPTEKKDQKVPVISDAEYAQSCAEYEELQSELHNEEEALRKKKEERDKLALSLYSRNQRNYFVEKMVTELANKPKTIAEFKQYRNEKNKKYNQELKDDNNGISYSILAGLTPPKKDSPVDKEYTRIDKFTLCHDGIDEKLAQEHTEYVTIAEQKILPRIDEHLSDQAATFDNNIRSFGRCDYCRTNDLEYKECLKKKSISEVSEESIQRSEDDIVEDTYNFMRDRNIPVTKENILLILEKNKITQGNFLKMRTSKENLKKAIRGELKEQPKNKSKATQESPEAKPLEDNQPKPHIVTDENN